MLAITLSFQKWKADLQSVRDAFLIITEHRAVKNFTAC